MVNRSTVRRFFVNFASNIHEKRIQENIMQNENKRIKVLEVIRQGQIGGGEAHLLDLVEYLDKTIYEPICLAFTDGEMITRMKAKNVECHIIETQKPFDRKAQKAIKQLMTDLDIQLVHAHGSRAASNVVFPARELGLPLIYTVHGWSFHNDQPWIIRQIRAWSEKMICNRAKHVICVSESNAETGRETFGMKECTVIENGINLRRFNPEGEFADSRQEFGFNKEDFVVGFIARNTKQKAPLDFLKALHIAHAKKPQIKGLFVGEGDLDGDTTHFIVTHHMDSYLYRSKFRLDVPDLLNTIDAYCLPSLWEGLSIALLEAMAMEKPVIATPTDGTKELITDDGNGIIVPFSQPESIANAMVRLQGSKNLCKRLGSEARQLVVRRFNATRVAREVEAIYRKALH